MMNRLLFILISLPTLIFAQDPLNEGKRFASTQDASTLEVFDDYNFTYTYSSGEEGEQLEFFNPGLYEGYWEMSGDTLNLNLDLGISRGKKLKFLFAQYLKQGKTLKLVYYSDRFDPRTKVEEFEEEQD